MRLLLLLAFLFSFFINFAQPKTLIFDHLLVENGLPENYATAIVQDKAGYIWIGTQNGLVRYDGYNTKVYERELLKKAEKVALQVSSLYIDRKDVLWIGTSGNGIYRYNSVDESFTAHINDSLHDGARMNKIVNDVDGDIWILDYDSRLKKNSLIRLDQQTGKYEDITNGNKVTDQIPSKGIWDIYADKSGKVWIGTNNGLFSFDKKSGKFQGYMVSQDSTATNAFSNIYEAPSQPGILYLSTASFSNGQLKAGGFTAYDIAKKTANQFTNFSGLSATGASYDSAWTFFEDSKKRFWIGTGSDLVSFDRNRNKFVRYALPDRQSETFSNSIFHITEDANGILWMGGSINGENGEKGLLYFDPDKNIMHRYLADNLNKDGLAFNYIFRLFSDRTGNIWLTFRYHGIQRINWARSRFKITKPEPGSASGFPGGKVIRFTQSGKGNYYIATTSGLLQYDTTTGFKAVALFKNEPAVNLDIRTLLMDTDGILWCGYLKNGLVAYDPKSGSIKNYMRSKTDTNSPSSNAIERLYLDKNKILWIGTGDAGLSSFNKSTGKFTRYPFIINFNAKYKGSALDDQRVISIFEDNNNRLWIGTNAGGLNLMNKETGKFTSYIEPGKGLYCINSIQQADSGMLWVSSYLGGVILFDPVKGIPVRIFNETNGLLCDVIGGIRLDNDGNLWVASQRGLSYINTKTFLIRNFTSAQGLPDNTLNTAPFRTSNGEMFIGYNNGFFSFMPKDLRSNSVVPTTLLQAVSYTNVNESENNSDTLQINGREQIKLAYDQNRVTFYYIGLQYENTRLTTYQYKLDGYDKVWINAARSRIATYTNLSPGKYTFYVKSANMDGVWNETPASIVIIINSPWWQTWWAYTLYAIASILIIAALIRWRTKRYEKEQKILEHKVTIRTTELRKSLEDLKSTQAQLVQSEKMASLGELTAGIAHEIQNPLNFINNFSEVSVELANEMDDDLKEGKIDSAKTLSSDIKQNMEKINLHGKRADAIVKNMLQHSRQSASVKEPTDLNALVDEYLRLSYHGLRARDKSFNAELITDFDNNISKVNIIGPEIGRVLLNLFTNSFYSVMQKKKLTPNGYDPRVTVTTKRLSDKVELIVHDNGVGIPQKVLDKIYNPFYTTKPTGEGTGLGLSLSYDIIVKGHGGEIKVNTEEGEYAEFIVLLPL